MGLLWVQVTFGGETTYTLVDMSNFVALLGLGNQELIIILVVVLVLFGGAKIPSLMKSLGQGVGEFKKGVDETKRQFDSSLNSLDEDPK